MVKVNEESMFPAPREKLWRVLELHLDNEVIGKIHPFIISSKRVDKEANSWVFERVQRVYGRTLNVTTRYEMTPMKTYRWEMVKSDGGVTPGSYIENKYTDVDEGTTTTKVSTKGETTIKGVPGFLGL